MNRDHLSLFSGIGGLDLAAEWAGFLTVALVERDKYCQRVLAKHWPGVPIYSDVAEVTADAINAGPSRAGRWDEHGLSEREPSHSDAEVRIAILSGGFPCQPHSVAGKRKASLDERDLWSECARITGEFKPRWAVFENVPGLLSSEGGTFFARVLGDLAALGYRVGWGVWGANDVGALHRRDRVFIVAHLADAGIGRCGGAEGWQVEQSRGAEAVGASDVADAKRLRELQPQGGRRHKRGWIGDLRADDSGGVRCAEPGMGRGPDGVSGWLDGTFERGIPRVSQGVPQRVQRLRALGNAVVPQQAYVLFKAIAEIEGITP